MLEYANNARFNPGNGNPYAPGAGPAAAGARPRGIYHRGVFLADQADELVLANLTIRNTTPQGGSQAEAIILNGGAGARAVLKDVDLTSYQDTLQINGQAYVEDCFITGDVDFLWGKGPCFFEDCTFRARAPGPITPRCAIRPQATDSCSSGACSTARPGSATITWRGSK